MVTKNLVKAALDNGNVTLSYRNNSLFHENVHMSKINDEHNLYDNATFFYENGTFPYGNPTLFQRNSSMPRSTEYHLTFENLFYSSLQYHIAVYIEIYALPLALAIGLPGNILTMVIMTKAHNRHNPCCWLMLMLSFSDSGYLLCGAYYYTKAVIIRDRMWTLLECQFIMGLFGYFYITSSYILMLLTLNRFIAICFPLVSKTFDTSRKTRFCFCLLITVALLFCLPILHTIDYVPFLGCLNFGKANSDFFTKIYSILYFFVGSVIPFFTLLILNTCIIISVNGRKMNLQMKNQETMVRKNKLNGSQVLARKQSDGMQSNVSKETNNLQLTRMLLFVTFTFLVLTLPQSLRFVVVSFIDYQNDPHIFSIFYLYFTASTRLFVFNSSVNFYLYCMSGTRFRRDVTSLFTKCKC